MADDLAQQIRYVRDATQRLLANLAGLTDADVARPSLCPGWTLGHVLTHIARSGDGLRRSVEGAERDELVPPYDSLQARADDIEAGARRPMADLVRDVTSSAQALDDAWARLDAAAWSRQMPHHRFGLTPVTATIVMRWYEVEIHHVDLTGAYHPRDWPAPFVAEVLSQAAGPAAGMDHRLPDGVALDLEATDTAQRWSFGAADGQRVTVAGPSWAIAAWLIGRPGPVIGSLSASGGGLPELTAWN